jgi:hypothetical protein
MAGANVAHTVNPTGAHSLPRRDAGARTTHHWSSTPAAPSHARGSPAPLRACATAATACSRCHCPMMPGAPASQHAPAAATCTPRRCLVRSCVRRAPALLPLGTHAATVWPPWHGISPPHLPNSRLRQSSLPHARWRCHNLVGTAALPYDHIRVSTTQLPDRAHVQTPPLAPSCP